LTRKWRLLQPGGAASGEPAGDLRSIEDPRRSWVSEARLARPFQAAWTSAASFSAGAALPLLVVALAPASARVGAAVVVTLIALGLLGDSGAQLGGAPRRRATVRVIVWGAVAMAITAAIGALVGAIV
jgi:VIT1/CCC1 family predicted Fe2+/Mn2+ transporter